MKIITAMNKTSNYFDFNLMKYTSYILTLFKYLNFKI